MSALGSLHDWTAGDHRRQIDLVERIGDVMSRETIARPRGQPLADRATHRATRPRRRDHHQRDAREIGGLQSFEGFATPAGRDSAGRASVIEDHANPQRGSSYFPAHKK